MALNPNVLFKHWTYRVFAPGIIIRQTYEAFKKLLKYDARSHELMAEFELLYHDGRREDFAAIRKRYSEMGEAVQEMVDCLEQMAPGAYISLKEYFRKFDFYIRFLLAPPRLDIEPPFVQDFAALTLGPDKVGNKAYNLAELKNKLQTPVPEGFVATSSSFSYFIEYNDLRGQIDSLLSEIDIESPASLQQYSKKLKELIFSAELPSDIRDVFFAACDRIENLRHRPVSFAVRSSAVSEDGEHSFAGQYQTVLGVDRDGLLDGYLQVLASKYSPEALFYRITLGLTDEETPMAVLVLEMIDAKAGGVIYTRNPAGGEDDNLLVQSIHGFGELLVSGGVTADTFCFARQNFSLIKKQKSRQREKLVSINGCLETVPMTVEEQGKISIGDIQAKELARWGKTIEQHYGTVQDVEWALADDDSLFLLQSRPLGQQEDSPEGQPTRDSRQVDIAPILEGGERAARGTASGAVFLLSAERSINDIADGAILVTKNIPPSLVRVMNKLAGVVADQGSTAGHFATVCREFGVPLLVGSDTATATLTHGDQVTIDADNKKVYPGRIEFLLVPDKKQHPPADLPYFKRLRAILDFITPLKLVDPQSPEFAPRSCRSLHDIIRFSHEKAVQAMFSLGDRYSGSSRGKRKLHTDIPLDVFLFDVGGGICSEARDVRDIAMDHICSVPFLGLWKGLIHPGIDWTSHAHFDWKSFDDVVMADGVVSKNSSEFASYAVIGHDYLNLNMRFGYHFTLVDSLCSENARKNYCLMRFAGGGGNYEGRSLRLQFLINVLKRIGFEVDTRADLLDARIVDLDSKQLVEHLEMLGRLLGATKLMDMVLRDDVMVGRCVEEFFNGRYNFSETSKVMNKNNGVMVRLV